MDELFELINGGTGENVKYDDDYMELQEEIDKLSSPTEAENVDFKKINELSKNILLKKSKDFFAAVYYSYSMIKLDVNSAKDAICFISEFTDRFLENGFPKRDKAKINAITWWLNKILPLVKELPVTTLEKNPYIPCIDKLESKLKDYENAPSFFDLRSILSEKIKRPAPEEPEKNDKTQQNEPEEETTPENASERFKDLMSKTDEVLTFLMEQEYKPEYFILNRMTYMYDINTLPMAENKKTLIPPPPYEVLNSIKTLYKSKNYTDLLNTCESKIKTYVFWIDLHFYVYESLKNLGHELCAEAVRDIARLFVKKLPGIETYTFSDGSAFVSRETKNWLTPQVKTVKKETKFTIPEGSLKEQVAYLNEKINTSEDVREKINWLMLILEKLNNEEVMNVYLNELYELLHKYQIEKIDKNLAVKAYGLIVDLADEQSDISKSAFKVLAVLNPSQFL